VNHESAISVGTIRTDTRRRTSAGTPLQTIATIPTSGTTGVGSTNSAGTNASIVG
jgi:hypothetical protein